MPSQIIIKNSVTGSAVPTTSHIVRGELALNLTDGRIYSRDEGDTIVELGTNPSTIAIPAGTIDGTVIGGTTPAAISGTTGQFATSLNVPSGSIYQGGSRKFVRVAHNSGGAGIFASIVDAPQTGIVHIYETGTDKYLILACFKKQLSTSVVTNVIANNGLTVMSTNAVGTILTTGYTTSGNVKMQATIYRET